MTTEEWRPVPDFDGLEVSDLGNVRSYWRGRGAGSRIVEFPAPAHIHVRKDGYRLVSHRNKKVLVHRLVALAFLGCPPRGQGLVRHLDDNPSNNSRANLAWGNQTENMADARRNGRLQRTVENIENGSYSKLTADAVREIRRRWDDGESRAALAGYFGVNKNTITFITKRYTWRSVT